MVRIAPRYDRRVLEALRALDDRRPPIAEVCRRVNAVLEEERLPRASYVHLRRLVHAQRAAEEERRAWREELLEIAADVCTDLALGRRVDAHEIAERVRKAGR